ncbi:MAG TPA: glycosyltransferase [Phototrophicaceae bacterium]|nr:glycosyltransferase [Phototrophicaceae bacterium]
MNILHLTPYYAPAYAFGGVTRAVEGMARSLAARGHHVTVLTTDALDQRRRGGSPYETLDSVRVVRVRNASLLLRGRFNLSTPLGMGEIAADLLKNADILHVHEFRTAENLIVTPVAERLDVRMVMSPHGTLTLTTGRSALKTGWDRLYSPGVGKRLSAVIALTAQEADDVRAAWQSFGLKPPRVSVIPNGVALDPLPDPLPFRVRYGLGDAPVCLFMGRLQQRKGIDVLVKAFQRIKSRAARLVIAGPDEGMLSAIKPLLDERMIVTGYLEGEDRLGALAAADLFCLPATGEGLSMAALEALAAGLPAILSPGCNLPEVAQYGAGVIVEPQVEPLAQALDDLLNDVVRREAMRLAARRLVHDRFTWESVAEQLEQVYQSAIM